MQSKALTIDQYLAELPDDRREAMQKLRQVIKASIPEGFQEEMNYGMIGYVVPHTIYPKGYHCDTKMPLPFFSIASQKNSINVYHMAIYMDSNLHDWFIAEFPKHSQKKLDMGKSCIRFKKETDIPYDLIGELMSKITVNQWIEMYEKVLNK